MYLRFFNYSFLVLFFTTFSVWCQIPNYLPANGLQGWWPFIGNANDLSQNAFNGTVNGAELTTDRFGATNSAYSFANSSSNIATTWPCIQGNNARSVSLWFKSDEPVTGQGTELALVAYGQLAVGKGFAIVMFANNQIGLDVNTSFVAYSPNTIGAWRHLVLTYDPVNGSDVFAVKMYLDGVLLTDVSRTFNPTTTINTGSGVNLLFGSTVTAGQYFNGKLDDIGIWDRALTAQEVQNLFSLPTSIDSKEISLTEVKIFPNPISEVGIIEGNFLGGDSYSIIDAFGKRCSDSALVSGKNYIFFNGLPGGLYTISTIINRKSYNQIVVKL